MSKVSAVIPAGDRSRSQNLELLVADLRGQSLPPDEIEIVVGMAPNGHARNVGVERTGGEILTFLDDDVRLGTREILRAFVQYLEADPSLGLVGTSQLLPPDSTLFQRRCARQISRSQSAVVDCLMESDMVTTQCCAIRRTVMNEVGGFHDRIIRGVDPELRYRIRKAGYRVAVIPHAWHYHPMPRSVRALVRMAWRNGAASAYARRHFPETVLYNPEGHVAEFEARQPFSRRVLRNAAGLLLHTITGRWYGTLYDLSYAGGQILGSGR